MPIDPVKIPQNVYIEDRIVGPLTLRQILTVALGGGVSYIIYVSAQKAMGTVGIVPTIVIWIPAALSVVFAFVTINDLSLLRLLLLTFESMNKPKTRLFEPRVGISINIKTGPEKPEKKAEPAPAPKTADTFKTLSVVLDTTAPKPTLNADNSIPAQTGSLPTATPGDPSHARSSLLSNATPAPTVFRDLSAAS